MTISTAQRQRIAARRSSRAAHYWWLAVPAMVVISAPTRAHAADQVPTPWNSIDIGSLKPAGEARADAGAFTLASGGQGIGGDADEFHYVYQSLSGDAALTARVSFAGAAGQAQAGLMIRDALATTSHFAAIVLSPGHEVSSLHRSAYEPHVGADTANAPGTLWIKLVKRGANVDAFFAPDAKGAPGAWNKLGQSRPVASGMVYVGLCLASHAPEKSFSAAFDHVALSSGTQPALDNGTYSIVPASAPRLMLNAPVAAQGVGVDIATPTGSRAQKWVFTGKGDGLYAIQPASDLALCLAVLGAKADSGAKVVAEADKGLPSQRWKVILNANGTYGLAPQFAPDSGLDDFGGNTTPGTPIDIWQFLPNDQHTQWIINAAP